MITAWSQSALIGTFSHAVRDPPGARTRTKLAALLHWMTNNTY